MKSYLSLIPISAKIHKRRNRMTLLCIIIAVFLVTTIFSMVDMLVRMETRHVIDIHGNWHIKLENISDNAGEEIAAHAAVASAPWYDVINLDMDKDYDINGRKTALCGVDETFVTDIMNYFSENAHLQSDKEIILSGNAIKLLGVEAGDTVTLNTPSGSYDFTISGFRSDDPKYTNDNGGETSALIVRKDQIGAFINKAAFQRIVAGENHEESNPTYYVRFKKNANMKKAIAQIREQYGLTDENIEQNTIVMGVMGISDNPYIKNVYPIPVVLFVLILLAGVLMISGSLNSNVVERAQFFGMLRCIGASRQQIIRFVRLEALNWCKSAIPAGIVMGIVTAWGLCAVMRYLVGGEFAEMTVFGVSAVGVICGILVGVTAVLIAAQAPARRAAKVSPMTAVSGNTENKNRVRHGIRMHIHKVETALGIHHAISEKKNFVLMTGSFALSIILFLSFSVLVELVGYLVPQVSSAPDISIASKDLSNTVDQLLIDQINRMEGVKHVFGRSYLSNVKAQFSVNTDQNTVDILSYSELELGWLSKDKMLRKGSNVSKVYGNSNYVLSIYDTCNPLAVGDKIMIEGNEYEVAGLLKYDPFTNDGSTAGKISMICSEETFLSLTGQNDYAIVDIQVMKGAAEEDVAAIHHLAGETYDFRDRRSGGESDKSIYWTFMLFVYGFLAIIALITILNIVNSISMSVSARIKQYGAMRAVGMEEHQLTRMIAAEAFTYAISGCALGYAIGLPLNKYAYDVLITSHYYYFTWSVPVVPIVIILFVVLAAAGAAVYVPSKRIKNMVITETINEL